MLSFYNRKQHCELIKARKDVIITLRINKN